MKDLDFDELDRAVNSLLGANNTPADQKTKTPESVVASGPVVDSLHVVAPVVRPAVQPLAARRSTGRFMDVVHPSSDMRSATIPGRPVSREGMNITPSVTSAPVVASDTLRSTPAEPVAVVEALETQQSLSSEWPDPIDFNGHSTEKTPEVPTEPAVLEQPTDDISLVDEDKDINQIADAINQTLNQDLESQAPLESPFLTDAKVEKRPLGAFSSEAITPSDSVSSDEIFAEPVALDAGSVDNNTEAPVEATDLDSEDHPTKIDAPLPAELQDELLLIEADTTDTTSPHVTESPALPSTQSTEALVGPTSITQQYAERPNTGDQPTGAIFDTEAYKKPLSHPAKKKSGWLFVLGIVLLLGVGAGAGALVFFYVLPML